MAKYSPHRWPSHSPTPSASSIRELCQRVQAGAGRAAALPGRTGRRDHPGATWGYLAGPALFLAVTIPLFHTIGWLGISVTSLVGGWTGEALARRRVARKAAARSGGVTVIPLEFRGTTEKWMAHLTAALTEYGREVHIAAESITVLPWATLEEG